MPEWLLSLLDLFRALPPAEMAWGSGPPHLLNHRSAGPDANRVASSFAICPDRYFFNNTRKKKSADDAALHFQIMSKPVT